MEGDESHTGIHPLDACQRVIKVNETFLTKVDRVKVAKRGVALQDEIKGEL